MTSMKRRRSNSCSDNNMQNDEAFLKLLSSQRELLHQLNYGGTMRRCSGPPRKRFSIVENHDFAGNFNFLTNNSISDPGNAMDLLTCSKRLSLGIGSDQFILPSFTELMAETEDNLKGSSSSSSALKVDNKLLDLECGGGVGIGDEPLWVKRQRRRSTLGYLRSIFQDDNRLDSTQPLLQFFQEEQSRRDSMQPLSKYVDSLCNADPLDQDVMVDPFETTNTTTITTTTAVSKNTVTNNNYHNNHKSVRFDDSQLKSHMEAFATSMERSAESQQSIHDWDRKMGLKRSHSKTMRMSSRSRKKLRNIVKKEINALSSASR